jgi:hypothetical protein
MSNKILRLGFNEKYSHKLKLNFEFYKKILFELKEAQNFSGKLGSIDFVS